MWLYNFGLTLYVWLIRLVAPRHPKARLWIDGRKDLYKRMAETIDPTDRIVWVHVASLGEFEQGRPIIERIRKTHPEYKILLTFFSPSGYEVRKNYQGVDYIFYLPGTISKPFPSPFPSFSHAPALYSASVRRNAYSLWRSHR